jgi:hypothetical protein
MKLIIIYGPEATGKLTVAKKLAAETGFRLFHNHISVDVARTLFDFDTKEFSDLIWDVRLLVFEHAAKANFPGLIFTWAYSHPDFLPYLNRIKTVVTRYRGTIHYVFVSCSVEEAERRVVQKDRSTVGKITSVESLQRQFQKKHYCVIPDTDTLAIDNTNLAPDEVVNRILTHFALKAT